MRWDGINKNCVYFVFIVIQVNESRQEKFYDTRYKDNTYPGVATECQVMTCLRRKGER